MMMSDFCFSIYNHRLGIAPLRSGRRQAPLAIVTRHCCLCSPSPSLPLPLPFDHRARSPRCSYTLHVAVSQVRAAAIASRMDFWQYVKEGSDPMGVAVMLEDAAAVR